MKYYLVGIKGTGMSALALLLDDLGFNVIGYDDAKEHRFTEDKLIERGIKIYTEENNAHSDPHTPQDYYDSTHTGSARPRSRCLR